MVWRKLHVHFWGRNNYFQFIQKELRKTYPSEIKYIGINIDRLLNSSPFHTRAF